MLPDCTMKILIVDDDKRIRKMLARAISGFASEVIECGDGGLALKAFEESRPDCVLMDLKMPGVDGIMATRQIVAAHPNARIVMVTSYDSPALREAAHGAGAKAYILKDDLSELSDTINGL